LERHCVPPRCLATHHSAWNGTAGRTFLRMSDKRLPPYGVTVRPCTIHAGRFRWDILENGRPVQSSPESFATKQEAEASGFTEIEKLISARDYKKYRTSGLADGPARGQPKHAGNRPRGDTLPRPVGLTIGKHSRQDSNLIKQSRLSLIGSSRPLSARPMGRRRPGRWLAPFRPGRRIRSQERCLRALNVMRWPNRNWCRLSMSRNVGPAFSLPLKAGLSSRANLCDWRRASSRQGPVEVSRPTSVSGERMLSSGARRENVPLPSSTASGDNKRIHGRG
jgi:hypothetical protein